MERPSHIAFNNRHFSHRLPWIGLALSFQLAAVWIFTQGLMGHWIPPALVPFKVDPIIEKQVERTPPPEPSMPKKIETVHVDQPFVDVEPGRPRETILATVTPPITVIPSQPPAGPDRAPVSVVSTHTTPPYPPIARRIGAEGKVTLRLTVSTEGRVSAAEVVNSSGRDELDQAAQQWILAHWSYKPALAAGVPVASKVLATVTFSLTNER